MTMAPIKGISLEKQMKEITKEIAEGINNAVDEALKEPPKLAKKVIMSGAPKLSGSYRKGWKIKRHRRSKSAIVYNATDPGLAHLLEYGHVTKNQYGQYTRTPAHPHIKPAEEQSVDLFLETIERELNNIL